MISRPSHAAYTKGTHAFTVLLATAGLLFAASAAMADEVSSITSPDTSANAPQGAGKLPLTPAGFTVKPVTITRMGLQWRPFGFAADNSRLSDPGPVIDGYHVEESLDGKVFTKIQDLTAGATFCNLADLKPATGYWFRIGAYNSNGVTYTPAVQVATIGEGSGLTGHYFTYTGQQNPVYPKYTRVDPYIDYDWVAMAAQDSGIDAHNFMVVWSGQIQPLYTETYTFVINSDDGDRLWIDGKKVIENWTDHAALDDTATVDLVAGKKYDIKLAYYENDNGPASVRFAWSSPTQAKQVVLPCQLYPKTAMELQAEAEPAAKPKPAAKPVKPHARKSLRLSHRRL